MSLTIKIHPRENINKYKLLKEKFSFIHIKYPSDKSIIEDLCEFDLIIGWLSTAMFEISLLGKKVLFYLDEKDLYEYNAILKYIPSEAIVTKLPIELKTAGKNINISNIIYFNKNEKAIDRFVKIIKKELNAK